jgi:hypothetical protein
MRAPPLLCLLLALASLSCSDITGLLPRPGTLLVDLTTPHSDDAALLLHLTGPSIAPASIAAAGTELVFVRSAASGGVNVAVFGTFGAGPLLRVQVPDVNRAREYEVSVIEAADIDNEVRASVLDYSVRFVKD